MLNSLARHVMRGRTGILAMLGALLTTSASASFANQPAFVATSPGRPTGSSDSVHSRFEYLAVGAVKPAGWILTQMQGDLQGFTGHLDKLTDRAASDAYGRGRVTSLEKTPAGMVVDTSRTWWNGETEAVWMDGLIRMAYLADDKNAKRKADAYIEHILGTQSADGYIGIYKPENRYRHPKENGELWTQSRIFTAMLAYYELTAKKEVLAAVEKAARLTMRQYGPGRSYFCNPEPAGGVGHGLMFVDIMEWLHRLTGDKAYIEFARFCYEDYCKSLKIRDKDNQLSHLLNIDELFYFHAAHTMEHLRVPLWLYYATGDRKLGQASTNALAKTQRYLTLSGACIGDEMIEGRKPGPDVPYEYCAMTELLTSMQSALAKTGNTHYAELVENVAFNAAQGARLPDGKGVSYLTRDNRFSAKGPELQGRFRFSPTHEGVAVCCNPNAGKLMPYYVNRMWMRQMSPEEGLAAVLYGPCNVTARIGEKGVKVRIDEETDYPFSEEIRLTVHPDRESAFPIIFRIPQWSTQARIDVKGAEVQREGDYYIIRKRWQAGDTILLSFDTKISAVVAANGETALRRGPLVYALPIAHVRQAVRSYTLPGFEDVEFVPAENTGIDSKNESLLFPYRLPTAGKNSDFGFIFHREDATDMLKPWSHPPVSLQGILIRDSHSCQVSLVPMGCTVLRRVTFARAENP